MGRTLESRVSITATSRSCWLLVSWNSSRWITERRTFFQRFCSPTVSLAFFFFVSGGSGVSWTLPFLCDMVRKSHDRVTMKLQKLTWIWIIREEGEFKQKDVKNKHFDRRQTLVDVIPTFTPFHRNSNRSSQLDSTWTLFDSRSPVKDRFFNYLLYSNLHDFPYCKWLLFRSILWPSKILLERRDEQR